jgi:hypothetical protein
LRGALYAIGGEDGDEGASVSPPWRYDAAGDAWVEAPLAAGSPIKTIIPECSWSAV